MPLPNKNHISVSASAAKLKGDYSVTAGNAHQTGPSYF
jgi:hypothetical protein